MYSLHSIILCIHHIILPATILIFSPLYIFTLGCCFDLSSLSLSLPHQTSDFTLYENIPGNPTRFELRRKKEVLVFQAETEEEKTSWTQDVWDLYFSHMLQLKGGYWGSGMFAHTHTL